ncbi:MAG: hypothetical protein ACI9IP_003620 [Arcticibacterium sp.]|jgi:hypothetical protein
MKIPYIILFTCFLCLVPMLSPAQDKFEREYRAKPENVSFSAKTFIDSIGPKSKVKWYKEISQNGISVEAKFEYQKKKFSIEFDPSGVLQDVEFIIKKGEIAPLVYRQIELELDSLFQKWRFQKIQM